MGENARNKQINTKDIQSGNINSTGDKWKEKVWQVSHLDQEPNWTKISLPLPYAVTVQATDWAASTALLVSLAECLNPS